MMIIMMIMLMPSVFSGTYWMIIMMTSIIYLMNLLLALHSNKITPMFDLDVVIQFRAWRPVLNPSRVQRWRCHHYHNHHHHRHCYHHHHHSHTQTYDHDDNIDDDRWPGGNTSWQKTTPPPLGGESGISRKQILLLRRLTIMINIMAVRMIYFYSDRSDLLCWRSPRNLSQWVDQCCH